MSEEVRREEIQIPKEHKAIVEKLGWDPVAYEGYIRVLERDGVTLEQLAQWKEEYGEVYRDAFVGKAFYYRTLTRKEYLEQVMTLNNYSEREEKVCELCTLHPAGYDFANGKGGIASRLMELILDKSGFITDGPTMSF